MTLIHQCDCCGYEGRVVELSDRYLCESCHLLFLQEQQSEQVCPECGHEGVTDTGICYACEVAPTATTDGSLPA